MYLYVSDKGGGGAVVAPGGEEGEIERRVVEAKPPQPLHKTVSLFIQALPPKITRRELEEASQVTR